MISPLRDLSFWLMGMLPFIFFGAIVLIRVAQSGDYSRSFIEGFLAWVVASYISAEVFGFFNSIDARSFLGFWTFSIGLCAFLVYRKPPRLSIDLNFRVDWPVVIIATFATVLLFICLTAEPNNWDSLTYHLPRIEHWIQNRSLEHFRTPSYSEIAKGPLAEILLLHTRLLSGSDSFYLLVQWNSMICCIIAAFRITGQLGGTRSQQWVSAVFAATLPIAILESTSTQNDLVYTALLAGFVSFGLEILKDERPNLLTVVATAGSGALAGIVKPVAYLSGGGFALWFLLFRFRHGAFRDNAFHALIVMMILAITAGPWAARNISTYGSVNTDLSLITNNKSHGIRQTLDNFILNVSLNLITGNEKIDRFIRAAILKSTSILGLNTHRNETVYFFSDVTDPNSCCVLLEDYGPSPLHCVLAIAAFLLLFRNMKGSDHRRRLQYGIAALFGFILLGFEIRWQSFGVRFQLPTFILMAPLVGLVLSRPNQRSFRTIGLLIALTLSGLPALLFNQTRTLVPLPGKRSYLESSADERVINYYSMEFNSALRYLVCKTSVSKIGLMMGADNNAEYPIWLVLRPLITERPIRVEHVNGLPRVVPGQFVPEIILDTLSNDPVIVIDGKEFHQIFASKHSLFIAIYAANGFLPKLTVLDQSEAYVQTESSCTH
jgi:hypothetical protein